MPIHAKYRNRLITSLDLNQKIVAGFGIGKLFRNIKRENGDDIICESEIG